MTCPLTGISTEATSYWPAPYSFTWSPGARRWVYHRRAADQATGITFTAGYCAEAAWGCGASSGLIVSGPAGVCLIAAGVVLREVQRRAEPAQAAAEGHQTHD
jgi:hypothetical protein